MHTRRILNVVDALETQNRLIVCLDCRHNVSIWQTADERSTRNDMAYRRGAEFSCPACLDPPPPTPADTRRAKSAEQLWKEAGQP